MTAIKKLAAAVAANVATPVDDVELVIVGQQNRYPASWQDWDHGAMVPYITGIIADAEKAGETSPERIVQIFG